MKKGLIFLVFIFAISICFLGFVNAEQCYVTTKALCQSSGNTALLGLSSPTNSHGETTISGNYDYVLCCDFSGSLTCTGNNKLLGLSSATNAHAEIPSQSNYATNVCYSDLECISTSYSCGGSQTPSYPIRILSFANYTNSHLGVIGDYSSINVCCKSSNATILPPLPNCGNGIIDSGEGCDTNNFNGLACNNFNLTGGSVLTCTSRCQVETIQCTGVTGFCGDGIVNPGESCDSGIQGGLTCESYGFNGGSLSCSSSCQVNTNQCNPSTSAAQAFWTSNGNTQISQLSVIPGATKVKLFYKNESLPNGTNVNFDIYEDDIFFDDSIRQVSATISNGKALAEWTITQTDLDKTPNDYLSFYFIAKGKTSNFLSLNVVSQSSVGNITFCSDYTNQDYCESDISGISQSSINGSVDCYDPAVSCFCSWDSTSGSCGSRFSALGLNGTLYGTCSMSDQQTDSDGCADGFLTISWTGNWAWADGNTNHTDPKGLSMVCMNGGTRVIECPAQVQLPFFNATNLVIALIAIIIIYAILSMRKKRRKKTRRF